MTSFPRIEPPCSGEHHPRALRPDPHPPAAAAPGAGLGRGKRWGVPTLLALVFFGAGCGGYSRFALRPPVWREADERPFLPAPAFDEEMDVANTVDAILLHPLAHGFLFEPSVEAHNVNALDEVPTSSWFTNRSPTPDEAALGPCDERTPLGPFTIVSSKLGGTSPGVVVQDATGQRYLFKIDGGGGEAGSAAEAIVSRLYWSVGFHVPCNRVLYVDENDLVLTERSYERRPSGVRGPLTAARLAGLLAGATRGADGLIRVSASRYIDGEPIGTWRGEGTRADDPNDVIPHENRRELRGERFLAAWVAHWDSRGPNTFDAFVRTSEAGGHVVHYFLDFGESLAGVSLRTGYPEPRVGFETIGAVGPTLLDMVAFGLVTRPWDVVAVDPRYPNMAYFDADHFDPLGFAPQTPVARWERAQRGDLAWMARRIARLGEEHVRAIVELARFSRPDEEARMVQVLLERRRRILRTAFTWSSPLTDLVVEGERLCALDLARRSDDGWEPALVVASVREGEAGTSRALVVEHEADTICVRLGPHFAPSELADDAAGRYAIVEIRRTRGAESTLLRAHLYDLGPERGWALVGIERPT